MDFPCWRFRWRCNFTWLGAVPPSKGVLRLFALKFWSVERLVTKKLQNRITSGLNEIEKSDIQSTFIFFSNKFGHKKVMFSMYIKTYSMLVGWLNRTTWIEYFGRHARFFWNSDNVPPSVRLRRMPLRYNIGGSPIQDFAHRESSLMEDGLFLVIFLELPVESSRPMILFVSINFLISGNMHKIPPSFLRRRDIVCPWSPWKTRALYFYMQLD